jgi:hypothetical protein
VARAESAGERVQLLPRFERPLLRVPPLRVLDPEPGRVDIEQSPADRSGEHLTKSLRRFEPVPGGIVIRKAAIAGERSWVSRRSPKTRTAFASNQRSFSVVSGSPACWAR